MAYRRLRAVLEDPPQARFTRSGDVSIAYQVLGAGPPDLVYFPAYVHHLELAWEIPAQSRFLRSLASLGRLLLMDKRGTGMSGRATTHSLISQDWARRSGLLRPGRARHSAVTLEA